MFVSNAYRITIIYIYIYIVDFCIDNLLPVNALSFVLLICLMDAADIERAKTQN